MFDLKKQLLNYSPSLSQAHEFDELRFDVSISNCVWYLRAETKEDRVNWIEVLQSYKVSWLKSIPDERSPESFFLVLAGRRGSCAEAARQFGVAAVAHTVHDEWQQSEAQPAEPEGEAQRNRNIPGHPVQTNRFAAEVRVWQLERD